MAATLSAFFAQNAEQIPNKKVVISNRFKDEDGNPVEWELKALDAGTQQKIRAESMEMDAFGSGNNDAKIKMNFNSAKANILSAVKAVVFPDLLNAELQNSYGVRTPEELIGKMLLPDEFDRLIDEIKNVSKDEAPEVLEVQAKN